VASGADRAKTSSAYDLFILVLTALSLVVMVALFLPQSEASRNLLIAYDNLLCLIFLADFTWRLSRSSPKRRYFFHERGWLDLLGSIPAFGVFRFSGLLRLARLSRVARISRLLREKGKRELVRDIVRNRGQYAALITVLAALLVLTIASAVVLRFESGAADANITSGGDAIWWAVVTITTVGYGDEYPVTLGGRLTAVFVMFTGVGIIGALASILSSVLVSSPEEDDTSSEPPTDDVRRELAAVRQELAALRQALAGGEPPAVSGSPEPPS
jgi:voltage-gated potassium channel